MQHRRTLYILIAFIFTFSNLVQTGSGHDLGKIDVKVNGLSTLSVDTPSKPSVNSQSDQQILITSDQVWRYFKGQVEPPADWNEIGFDDSAWLLGYAGIGYGPGYSSINKTTLTDMYNRYLAVYLRSSFEISNPNDISHIWLNIDYDDGFVAYLNGVEVARRNMGAAHAPAAFTQAALGYQDAGSPQMLDLTDHLTTLVAGENVLAVQVHNVNITSSDLSITPILAVESEPNDLADVLILYDLNGSQSMDINFRFMTGYYGLKYAAYDVASHSLSAVDLLDASANPYPLIAICEEALSWLDTDEQALLQNAIQMNGVTLFVYDIAVDNSPEVSLLTNGAVTGAFQPEDSSIDWVFGSSMPVLTREFSGQTLNGFQTQDQVDYGLLFGPAAGGGLPPNLTSLLRSSDDASELYTLFAAYTLGSGTILLQGRNSGLALGSGNPLHKLYTAPYLSEVTPLMMAIRFAAGDEAWQRSQDTANFTIDDPYLKCDDEPGPCHWKYIYWQALLDEMVAHNFHTTIAMIPKNYHLSMPEVVNLVQQNPQYYSLAVHGNNHDNGLPPPDNCPEFTPQIPAADQENDIKESIWRMMQHRVTFQVPFSRVMVFPCGRGSLVTFDLLKKYNFSLTTNGVEAPTDATPANTWDRRMDLAELAYSNFPNLLRSNTETATLNTYSHLFDLFLDQPVMLYSHASYELTSVLSGGVDGFSPYADAINNLPGEVIWQDLEGIAQQLYKQKVNDDGVIEVRVYSNHIRLQNPGAQVQNYVVKREENFAYPLHILLDGQEIEYQANQSETAFSISLQPQTSRDVVYAYNTGLVQTVTDGLAVSESGMNGGYTLQLLSEPEAEVTVDLQGDGQVMATPNKLVFTPENWNNPKIITIHAVDDGLAETLYRVGVITHTVSSESHFYNGIQTKLSVPVWQYPIRVYLPFIQK